MVPVVYASFTLDDEPIIANAIDEKPKGNPRALRRVRNSVERPEIALVIDEYHEDWDAYWDLEDKGIPYPEKFGRNRRFPIAPMPRDLTNTGRISQ